MKTKRKQRRPRAAVLAVPERVRARQLYNAIIAATMQLAKLASAELSNQEQTVSAGDVTSQSKRQYATFLLAALPGVSTRAAVEVLADAPDAPCKLSQVLTVAMTGAVQEFSNAVDKHPSQFQQWARRQLVWPTLRAVNTKSGKKDPFPSLVEKLCLGADANVKRDGCVDWQSIANQETAKRLLEVGWLREWAAQAGQTPVAPWVKELAATQFQPLTKKPEALRFWFERGLKPVLKMHKEELMNTTLLAKRNRDKTDAVVWNDFLKSCHDALEALAPPP